MDYIPYPICNIILSYFDPNKIIIFSLINKNYYNIVNYRFKLLNEYTGFNVNNKLLLKILRKTQNLVVLKLEKCFLINSSFFSNISNNLVLLEELILNNEYYITNECISIITKNTPKLHSINLDNCKNICNISLKTIAENCNNIYRISLQNCNKINNDGIIELTNIRKIGYLNVANCCKITNTCFFKSNIEHLKYLNVDFCFKLLDYAINYILLNSLELEYINISNCDRLTDNLFFNTSCKNFKKIYLQRIPNLTLLTIPSITSLIYLNLYSLYNLDENSLIRILKLNPNLIEISLKFCNSITRSTINALSIYNKNLEVVKISYCHNLLSINIDSLLLNLNNLRYINITYGIYIEFFGLDNKKTNYNLEELTLSNCPKISSYYLIDLFKKCNKLKFVCINGCVHITSMVINTLINYNSHTLTVVDLTNCKYIQNYQIKKLLNNCKKIKVLFIGKQFNIKLLRELYPNVDIK